jgi:23S rRNA (adenine2030-N6)-methyltransferase
VLPADTPIGLRGSGLVIVNPPWQLDARLGELLPDLHRLLVPDPSGGTSVTWWAEE